MDLYGITGRDQHADDASRHRRDDLLLAVSAGPGFGGRASGAPRVDAHRERPAAEIREQLSRSLSGRELYRHRCVILFYKDQREIERGAALRVDEAQPAVDGDPKASGSARRTTGALDGDRSGAPVHLNLEGHAADPRASGVFT